MRGFSIIELSLVILIIGILATGVLPKLVGKTPNYKKFVEQLNYVTQNGKIYSIENGQITKILFDLNVHNMYIQDQDNQNISKVEYPNSIEILDFLIDGKSQFSLDSNKLTFWFYINKNGIMQNVNIIIKDENSLKSFNIEVNPFSGRFYIKYND